MLFSTNDDRIIGAVELNDDRINRTSANAFVLIGDNVGARWGVWFANGQRIITSNEDLQLAGKTVKVYPNPFSQQLNIEFDEALKDGIQFELYDLAGQLIQTRLITNQLEAIDLNTLNAGAYVLKLTNQEGVSQSQRIIKMK